MKKNRRKIVEDISVMISVMSDDMPIYDFNLLKHKAIVEIDRRKKKPRYFHKQRDL